MDILLSAVEVVRRDPEDLDGCETLIVANYQRNNWLKVGAALLVIHDTSLFKKSGADSFSSYISTKADFGFGPRQALRLLAATKLARIFPPTIALPTSERQVRALVGLEPRKAIKTWVKANLISQETGVPLTHRLVESVLSKDIPESYRAACADWRDFVHPESEYYRTPYHVVSAVKRFFGGTIDLDPCGDELSQVGIGATRFYTAEDDGLQPGNPWSGCCYVFPPVGMHGNNMLQGLFLERAVNEFKAGRVTDVVLLLKVAIGQKWFLKVFEFPHCFLADKPLKPQELPPPGWGVPDPDTPAAALQAATAALLNSEAAGAGPSGGRGDEGEEARPSRTPRTRKRAAPADEDTAVVMASSAGPSDGTRSSRPRRAKATAAVAAAAAAAAAEEEEDEEMEAPAPPPRRTRAASKAAAAAAGTQAAAPADQMQAQQQGEQMQQALASGSNAPEATNADPLAAAAAALGLAPMQLKTESQALPPGFMLPGQDGMGMGMAAINMAAGGLPAYGGMHNQAQPQPLFAPPGMVPHPGMMGGMGMPGMGMQMGALGMAPMGLAPGQGQELGMAGTMGHSMGPMMTQPGLGAPMGMPGGMGMMLPGMGMPGGPMGQLPGQAPYPGLPGMPMAFAAPMMQAPMGMAMQPQQQFDAAAMQPQHLMLQQQQQLGMLPPGADPSLAQPMPEPQSFVQQLQEPALQAQPGDLMLIDGSGAATAVNDPIAAFLTTPLDNAVTEAQSAIGTDTMEAAATAAAAEQAVGELRPLDASGVAASSAAVDGPPMIFETLQDVAAAASAPATEASSAQVPAVEQQLALVAAEAPGALVVTGSETITVTTASTAAIADGQAIVAVSAAMDAQGSRAEAAPVMASDTTAEELPLALASPDAALTSAAAPPAAEEDPVAALLRAAAETAPAEDAAGPSTLAVVPEAAAEAAPANGNGASPGPAAAAGPSREPRPVATGTAPTDPSEVYNPRGMVLVYIGKNVKQFCDIFSELGHIPGYNAWSR